MRAASPVTARRSGGRAISTTHRSFADQVLAKAALRADPETAGFPARQVTSRQHVVHLPSPPRPLILWKLAKQHENEPVDTYDGVALLLLVVHVCLLWKYAEAAEPESKLLSVRINRS
jgi:hypothetical protein